MRNIVYTATAAKQMDRLSPHVAAAIEAKLIRYAGAPQTLANQVKTLSSGLRRLRVGDHRVIFTEDMVVLDVLMVGPRGSVYR
jgi:mRNA interferase RelE/StbE